MYNYFYLNNNLSLQVYTLLYFFLNTVFIQIHVTVKYKQYIKM